MLKKLIFITVLTVGFFALGNAAVNPPNPSSQSTGSVDINLQVKPLVKISDLTDITVDTNTGAPFAGSTPACIFSNTTGNKYDVTVTGSGTGSAFTVTDGTNTVTYTATWKVGTGAAQNLTSGTALTGLIGSNSVNCNNTSNSTFAIDFSETAIASAPQGTYTGTATIVIDPA